MTEKVPASWTDHSRDLLHMINHFRAQMPHPLIGIGHSIGPAQLFATPFHPKPSPSQPAKTHTQSPPLSHASPSPLNSHPHRARHVPRAPPRPQHRPPFDLPPRPLALPCRRRGLPPRKPLVQELGPGVPTALRQIRSPPPPHSALPRHLSGSQTL